MMLLLCTERNIKELSRIFLCVKETQFLVEIPTGDNDDESISNIIKLI